MCQVINEMDRNKSCQKKHFQFPFIGQIRYTYKENWGKIKVVHCDKLTKTYFLYAKSANSSSRWIWLYFQNLPPIRLVLHKKQITKGLSERNIKFSSLFCFHYILKLRFDTRSAPGKLLLIRKEFF